jgi:hypothetical protein
MSSAAHNPETVQRSGARHLRRLACALLLPVALVPVSLSQGLGSNCTATFLNHSVQVNADGTFNLPNIPYGPGLFRVHVVCTNSDGTTSGGESDPMAIVPNGAFSVPLITIGAIQPSLTTITVSPDSALLNTVGATDQINVIGTLADGTHQNYSGDAGTTYQVSNPAIASVSSTGLLTALGAGVVTITVRNDGLVGTTSVNINALIDTDGDGMPDSWEIAHGLNPYDPTDAGLDPDNDGLTNLQEYQHGTDPHIADTDGDGLSDGQEVALGTNPLVADTDGDGLTDGQEVALGTNPLLADTDGDGIPDGLEVKLGTNPLVPDPTTVVTGQVIDGNNKPVAGASVTVLQYFVGTTDIAGMFSIPFVPTDVPSAGGVLSATVIATISGGGVENGTSKPVVPVANSTTSLGVIQLGASMGVVNGTVTYSSGKAVAGAQVSIAGSNVTLTTMTGVNGTYTFTNLPGGTVVVTVLDPATSLRGQASGLMPTNTSTPLTLNVTLGGYGGVAGNVITATGSPAASGITVTLSGSTSLTTTTGPLGAFSFPFVPLGAFVVTASDSLGDTGSNSGFIATTNETITSNITFLGNGTVSGKVADTAGNLAVNATVTLLGTGTTPQSLTTQTDASGHYSFSQVNVGSFAVSAGLSGTTSLGGTTMASLTTPGQSLTVNITLNAAGSASGVVVHADGVTPAANVNVMAMGSAFSTTTNSQGQYQLNFLPGGSVTLHAADPSDNDQGSVVVPITVNTVNPAPQLVLDGVGTVNVTVTDASGNPVPSAQLTLTSDTSFTQQIKGLASSTGTYTFTNVLAGALTVMASNPVNQLAGTAQATVTSGGTANVTVQLQAAGTISGTVFASDGATPTTGITVQLDGATTTISASDGTYQFATVPTGTHVVVAIQGTGQFTSPSVTAAITSQGQVATANLVLIGRGTVSGNVTNADGSIAALASVSVQSLTAGFAQQLSTETDVNGNYSISNVPTGPISVGAYTSTASAQTTTTLPTSAAVTINLVLATNQTRSAQTFTDANAFTYDVDSVGELGSGYASVFLGVTTPANDRHSDVLTITNESTNVSYPFTGSQYGTVLQSGQEVAIEQDGIAGLNVVRHVYVPSNGYMARYLEVLTNPTSSDIIVTVALESSFRFTHEARDGYTYEGQPEVVATSSGDASFNITSDPAQTDHWLVSGTDEDLDPFLNSNAVPTMGYVFDDGNGPVRLTSGGFTIASVYSQLNAAWQHVRVPANSTVELMHFTSQQVLRAAAQASAQRLIQLPPEALTGLSAADAAAIVNFAVPSNLTSSLTPLATLTGAINGTVVAGDNTTPVAGAVVNLQSVDPLFFRTYQVTAYSNGSFNFQGNVVPGGGVPSPPVAVPLEQFNVFATHPVTGVVSPTFLGGLSPSLTLATQPIVFSNSGQQNGTVYLNANTVVTNGTVTLNSPALTTPVVLPIQGDGTYSVTGLPVGSYTATASVTGTFLTGSVTTQITNGNTSAANIFIVMGGILQGQVLSSGSSHPPLPNITVYLQMGAQTLSAVTSSTGAFTFTDVPPGSYALTAYDPVSNTAASVNVNITMGGTTTQNLTLASTGAVAVTVTAPSGTSVTGLTVTLTPTQAGGTVQTATTDANGNASFTGVQVGGFTVSASAGNGYSGSVGATLGLAGQTLPVTLPLGPHGVVNGTILNSDDKTPAVGIQVQIYTSNSAGQTILTATTTTSSTGAYLFNTVPVGGFTVVAQNLADGDIASGTSSLVTVSQQVTLNLTLTGVGNITVTVLNASSQPDAGAQITAYGGGGFGRTYTGTSNAQGVATLTNVLAGSVQINAIDPTTHLSGQSTITLTPGAQATASITLQASETITGHVYLTGGTAAAAGAQLRIYAIGAYYPYTTTTAAADGSYTLFSIPLGPYVINVYDSSGNFRTYANLTLSAAGQTVTQNFTFVGLGTVKGTVSNPDGTAATGIGVQIISQSVIGGTFNSGTDSSGNYSIADVPVGGFQVTAQNLSAGLSATVAGAIASDGDIETVNLTLSSNVVSLAQTLTDFNGFPYDIQQSGVIANGAFVTDPLRHRGYAASYNNAFALALYQSGNPTNFTGASTAVTTLNGQQLNIAQVAPIDGLNVTRRVYTPSTGYFTRYLEVLSNPGTAPITVDVQVSGGVAYPYPGTVNVTTSSGDAALSTADDTIVQSAQPANYPYPYSQAAMGEAFQGPGATAQMSVATYVLPNSTNNLYYPQLTYRWNSITVPAGGEVAFLHFTTQQTTPGQASASVARLDQLPPEGLTGISSTDLNAIVNFAIPAGGVSQLQPLTVPALGSVTGHLYSYDGTTPIPGGQIVVSGTNLYLGATATQLADTNGQFNFVNFPVENYTLQGTDPLSLVASPLTPGSFAAGSSNSSTDILMSNTGNVAISISAPAGTNFSSGSITISSNSLGVSATENLPANGNLTVTSLPAGTYTLASTVYPVLAPSQGTSFYITQTVTVVNGQTTAVTVNLPQVGSVSGIFTSAQGKPESGAYVYLSATGINRSEYTGSDGSFSFPQVPNGTYTLMGYDSASSLTVAVSVTIASNAVTQNLQIASGGTINLTVNYASGQPASNSLVTITRPNGTLTEGVTNASGQIAILNQPVGSYTIVVYYPGQPISYNSVYIQSMGSVTSNGQTLSVTVAFPPVGAISGVVNTYGGVPSPGAQVSLIYTSDSSAPYDVSVTADVNGNYSFNPVISSQPVELQAHPANIYNATSQTTTTSPAAGQTLTQNLTLPVAATVLITAEDGNNNPLPNDYITISGGQSTTSIYTFGSTQLTGSNGVATFSSVPDATYSAILYDSNFNQIGSGSFVVHTSDDSKTVQVVIQTGFTGTVSGTLLAADGVTPVPPPAYSNISLYDADTNTDLADYTSTDGTFTFPQVLVGRDGFYLAVTYTSSDYTFPYLNIANAATGAFTANNQNLTLNVTLPVPVVSGVVYLSDGVTPAANPTITVNVPNNFNPITFYGISDANGNYSVALPIQDQAGIFATANGLTTQAQVYVQPTDTVDTQNITLTTSGTVTGNLSDISGGFPNPVEFAQIQVISDGSSYTLFTETDGNGNFTVDNVATGNITVNATLSYLENCTATGSGQLVNNGDTLTVNLTVNESTCTTPAPSVKPAVGSPQARNGKASAAKPATGAQPSARRQQPALPAPVPASVTSSRLSLPPIPPRAEPAVPPGVQP